TGTTWVQGAVHSAGQHGNPSAPPLLKSPNIIVNQSGRSLDELLDAGEIDALIGTRVPSCYRRNPDIVRLFPNYPEVEREFYRRTGIYPIMHLVAMRREIHDRHPAAAAALYTALVAAKDRAVALMRVEGAPRYMLPWLQRDIEE